MLNLILITVLIAESNAAPAPIKVTVPLVEANEIDLSEVVVRLARATNLVIARPQGEITLPISGVAGTLSREMLGRCLGSEVGLSVGKDEVVLTLDPVLLTPSRRDDWRKRVQELARESDREAKRRTQYGMHALNSYRPNDPGRPTICLVHGVNSSSVGFVHMIPWIEKAGYGVVVFDYRYNRRLEDSCKQFLRDWIEFRRRVGEKRPWALVTHSMGALIARDYVEGPPYQKDVSTLVMIAPVNQGSYLAQTQTILQLLHSSRAVQNQKTSDALAHLGDGLGEAARDMTPGSAFLKTLNARPRRSGLDYHILAGDVGVIPKATRRQIEAQVDAARAQRGLFGSLARMAVGDDISERLDELTDGSGDGCVSVARTRLAGVSDNVVIHANHAELIRAPLLFADPGPVPCMPDLLRWVGEASIP